jgi:hypothetical protein
MRDHQSSMNKKKKALFRATTNYMKPYVPESINKIA